MQNEFINLLGKHVRDKVTNFSGVVTSVSFDLYGCIQAVVTPPMDAEGKKPDSCWFDVTRLAVTHWEPVMPVPDFTTGPIAQGLKGPAEKPSKPR